MYKIEQFCFGLNRKIDRVKGQGTIGRFQRFAPYTPYITHTTQEHTHAQRTHTRTHTPYVTQTTH